MSRKKWVVHIVVDNKFIDAAIAVQLIGFCFMGSPGRVTRLNSEDPGVRLRGQPIASLHARSRPSTLTGLPRLPSLQDAEAARVGGVPQWAVQEVCQRLGLCA